MRWLLWNVDWSLGNNRIHCSSGASLQATGLAHEMHGRRQLPQSGLVHYRSIGVRECFRQVDLQRFEQGGCGGAGRWDAQATATPFHLHLDRAEGLQLMQSLFDGISSEVQAWLSSRRI